MTLTTSPRPTAATTTRARVWTQIVSALGELVLVLFLFTMYNVGRRIARHHTASARSNAEVAHRVDTWLSHPSTPWIQQHLGHGVLHAADLYYKNVHFPLTSAFVVGCYVLLSRRDYVWMRNTLFLTTFSALLIEMCFPLAPPRMFPDWGYVDTMNTIGPSAYAGHAARVANQLAAMPSLHVGWSVLVALTLWRHGPRWLGALGIVHALTTITVVTITANHWRIDGIVAIALVFAADRIAAPSRSSANAPLLPATAAAGGAHVAAVTELATD